MKNYCCFKIFLKEVTHLYQLCPFIHEDDCDHRSVVKDIIQKPNPWFAGENSRWLRAPAARQSLGAAALFLNHSWKSLRCWNLSIVIMSKFSQSQKMKLLDQISRI